MTAYQELSAGVIPYRWAGGQDLLYLVLHSATVRNPRARWEFPKGGIEPGETPREAAAREFREETSLSQWEFREGFERNLSYMYVRKGHKILKTVTYYIVEVHDTSDLARSFEHVPDPSGRWHQWGNFEQITRLLYHAKIRNLFREADMWLRGEPVPPPAPGLEA